MTATHRGTRGGPAKGRAPALVLAHVPAPVSAARAAWGLVLLSLARPVSQRLLDHPATRTEVRVVRVLGARHLAQAAVVTAVPGTAVLGLLVDLTHLASMLLLAAVDRSHRRAALASATVAGTFVAASVARRRPS